MFTVKIFYAKIMQSLFWLSKEKEKKGGVGRTDQILITWPWIKQAVLTDWIRQHRFLQ